MQNHDISIDNIVTKHWDFSFKPKFSWHSFAMMCIWTQMYSLYNYGLDRAKWVVKLG